MIQKTAYPRLAVLVVSSIVGVSLYWFSSSPMGLLLPVFASMLRLERRGILVACAAVTIALACAVIVGLVGPGGMRTLAVVWGVFFAVALGCVLVLGFSRPVRPLSSLAEGVAPNASRNRPPVLTEQFLSLVHPDDRDVASQASSRAFWSGFPQIIRYRQLQPDGSYSWTEFRAEPERAGQWTRPVALHTRHLTLKPRLVKPSRR
jgi:hypothetical protein